MALGSIKELFLPLLSYSILYYYLSYYYIYSNNLSFYFLSFYFYIIIASSSISNSSLLNYIFNLLTNIQLQPTLTCFWYKAYISALLTTSIRDPNGTILGLYQVYYALDLYYIYKNNFSIYNRYYYNKKGSYIKVYSYLRVSINFYYTNL